MNIMELMYVVIFFAAGYYSGKFASSYWGIAGWIIGIPFGCFLALLIYWIIGELVYACNYNKLPICKKGRCQSKDYEHVEIRDTGWVFRCQCGDNYLLVGNRFLALLEDGAIHPYMRRARFRPWQEDKTCE